MKREKQTSEEMSDSVKWRDELNPKLNGEMWALRKCIEELSEGLAFCVKEAKGQSRLREFEDNVNVVIGSLNEKAGAVKEWLDDWNSTRATSSRWMGIRAMDAALGVIDGFSSCVKSFKQTLWFLRCYVPKFENGVENERSQIMAKAKEIAEMCAHDLKGVPDAPKDAGADRLLPAAPPGGGTGKRAGGTKETTTDAYIPFGKAIELSNGILSRKKLERAIKLGEPLKVRCEKPSKQRRTVHIQDVLALIKKLSASEAASEQAVKMFARYKSEFQKKVKGLVNLD